MYRPRSRLFSGDRCTLTYREGLRWRIAASLLSHNHRFLRLSREQVAALAQALWDAMLSDGRIVPSRDWLAARLGCCPKTVDRAKEALRLLGLIDWTRRLKIGAKGLEQTSNSYVLRLPGMFHVPQKKDKAKDLLSFCYGPRKPVDISYFRHAAMIDEWLDAMWRRYMQLE